MAFTTLEVPGSPTHGPVTYGRAACNCPSLKPDGGEGLQKFQPYYAQTSTAQLANGACLKRALRMQSVHDFARDAKNQCAKGQHVSYAHARLLGLWDLRNRKETADEGTGFKTPWVLDGFLMDTPVCW